MNRVGRLTGDNPLLVHVVIDETALTRPIGGPGVLKAQLRHLRELSRLPNVTIQVLRTEVGANLGLRAFPPDTISDLGYIDHAAGNLQISKPTKMKELRRRFDAIASVASTEGESEALISRLAGD